MLSEERLQEIRARCQAATPGPWRWRGNLSGKCLRLTALIGLRPIVMSFERWGMQSARPVFRNERDVMVRPPLVPSAPHNPWDIIAIDHPDARFIEHARQDVDDLLAEVERLRQRTEPSE